MNSLMLSAHGWQVAGWTMVYFMGLGSLVALVAAVVRFAMRSAAPSLRYTVSLAAFATLALLPVGIAVWLLDTAPPVLSVAVQPPPAIDLARTPVVAPATVPAVSTVNSLPSVESLPEMSSPNWSTDEMIVYLPWLWIVGTPLTFLLLATGLVGAERLRRSSRMLENGPLHRTAEQLRMALGLGRHVAVAVCDRVATPLLVGIVRPLILLPPAALTGWPAEDLEMVLLHELAHVRRWDNLVNLGQRIVESALFFHPAVWLLSHWVRMDREDCCDAVVVAQTAKPQAYAELLLSLASASQPLAGLALARHPLGGRIRRILRLPEEPMRVSRGTLVAAGTALLALLFAVGNYDGPTSTAEDTNATSDTQTSTEAQETAKESIDAKKKEFDRLIRKAKERSKASAEETAVRAKQLVQEAALDRTEAMAQVVQDRRKQLAEDMATRKAAALEDLAAAQDGREQQQQIEVVYNLRDMDKSSLETWIQLIEDGAGVKAQIIDKAGCLLLVKATEEQMRQIAKRLASGDDVVESVMPVTQFGAEQEDDTLHPGDVVALQVLWPNTDAAGNAKEGYSDDDVTNEYRIESMGTIALGPIYGRVKIAGHDLIEAEELVTKQLVDRRENHLKPAVQLTFVRREQVSSIMVPMQNPLGGTFQPPAGPLTVHLFPNSGTSGGVDTPVRSDDLFAEKSLIERHLAEENAKIDRALQGLAKQNAEAEAQFATSEEPEAKTKLAKARKTHELLVARLQQEKFAIQEQQNRLATNPDVLQPGDVVLLQVKGTLPDEPITGEYKIESMGTIALGPTFDRVHISGLNVLDAEATIKTHLRGLLENPLVQLTLKDTNPRPSSDRTPRTFNRVPPHAPTDDGVPAGANEAQVLYDGKTFEEWRDLWKTELKTENRLECINALAAFGRAGRGKAAFEAILEVAEQYDFSKPTEGSEKKLRDRILRIMEDVTSCGENKQELFDLMLKRTAQNGSEFRPVADVFVCSIIAQDEETRQKLLEIASNEDDPLCKSATYALVSSDRDLTRPETVKLARRALQGNSPDTSVFQLLYFRRLDLVPEQYDLLFHSDPHVRATARDYLNGIQPVAGVIDSLLSILRDPSQASKQADAIRALRATKRWIEPAEKERVVSQLEKVVRKGDEQLLGPALLTLNEFSDRSTGLSVMYALKNGQVSVDRKKYLEEEVESLQKQISDELKQEQYGEGGYGGGEGGGFF